MYNKLDSAMQYSAQSKVEAKVIGCLQCYHPISRSRSKSKPNFNIRQSFNNDVFLQFLELKAMYKHSRFYGNVVMINIMITFSYQVGPSNVVALAH